MNDEQILKLARLAETQLCGILMENGICSYRRPPKDKSIKTIINKFDNLQVLEPYNEDLNYKDVTDEQVTKLRKLYPSNSDRTGTVGIIKNKLIKYLNNNPSISYDDIYNAISQYVTQTIYSGNVGVLFDLDNIFYKQDSGGLKSPIDNILLKYSKDISSNLSPDDILLE